MRWKALPYWVRSGIIASIISLGVLFLLPSIMIIISGLRPSKGWLQFLFYMSSVALLLLYLPHTFLSTISPQSRYWFFKGAFDIPCPPCITEKAVSISYPSITGWIVILLFWFLAGAIIGWLYSWLLYYKKK